ncbi:hypothetical protein [uncultured Sulfitobacter sp.]|uniref:DUF7443 domain-containing protein n=1 Tax=uncultured Sulfitobacter sp. TaxID=191468 RepID=UPI00259260EE|nr:hypothetical protein [uncultured Sulfitobacter sp.]
MTEEKKSKMVEMVPLKGCKVVREGARVRPTIGKAFKFTEEEVTSINGAAPGTLRAPTNEAAEADAEVEEEEVEEEKPKTTKKKAPAKKKKAAAAEDDDEDL